MPVLNNIIRWVMITIIFSITYSSVMGQASSTQSESIEEQLEIFSDSLNKLLLAHQPMQVLQISDSLLYQYGHLISPAILKIKSARANAYELLYNFEAALEIYNELVKIAEKAQFIDEEIAIRLSLARVLESISRPELCIQNLEEAKKLIDEHGKIKQLSRYYIRYASYVRIYERDKPLAKELAAKAVELGKEHGVIRSVADGYLLLGVTTEDFEEAIAHFQKASSMFFELGDQKGGMSQQMNIAKRYLQREDYDEVLDIINTVDEYTKAIKDNDKLYYQFKMEISKVRSDVYERTGEKDNLIGALKNYNEYSRLFGFLVNQEHINQLLLDSAVGREKEKVEAANKTSKILTVGLVILSAIIFLLFRLYRQNIKRKNKIQKLATTISTQYNELEKLYNYKITLLSEVHHRIKNNLQLIISLFTLQKAKLSNDFDKGVFNMLSHRINSISLIHEQLYNQKEFDKVDVNLYITNLIKNFKALVEKDNGIIEHRVIDIHLNLETITPLGLIWSELISNSLKYNKDSDNLKIDLDLVKNGDYYFMHYKDNGKGYPDDQFTANTVGMGYTIVHSLSRQLAAKTKSYNSNGAHFTLEFKEKMISPL